MKNKPIIKTKLPGPKSSRLVKTDEKYISASYTRVYPLIVKKASGVSVIDEDGNRFLDFTAGVAVNSTGHCHPKILKAISSQAKNLIHMSGTDFYYKPEIELAKKLTEITPGKFPKKVFFTNSGAESIEAAFKLSRYDTKRQRVIAFIGAFHGRTFGAMSLSGSNVAHFKSFSPMVPEVYHVGYGYCYRCPYNLRYGSCDIYCIKYIEDVLFKRLIPAEEVAAIFVEPIQGEGGYVVPPPEFHPMLRDIAHKYGILYVADEVQSGMGRTGKMFALEHWNVVPDIVCIAKGIASGMPLGAMVAKSDIMIWKRGSHASTFGGNPVSCAASLETIKLLEGGLIKNAEKIGGYIISELKRAEADIDIIGDVRGKGLMIGIEIVKNKSSKEKDPETRNKIIQKCFQKGLLILGCGENTLRLCPSLTITKSDADIALEILLKIIKKN